MKKNVKFENNVTINYDAQTIEITKQYAKLAGKFNSREYKELKDVREAFPTFTVKVKSTSAKRKSSRPDSYKGLTYEYMESYIKTHDDENNTTLNELYSMVPSLKNKDLKTNDPLTKKSNYIEVKKWFLDKYEKEVA